MKNCRLIPRSHRRAFDHSSLQEENQVQNKTSKLRKIAFHSPTGSAFYSQILSLNSNFKFHPSKIKADICLLSYNSRGFCNIKQNFLILLVSISGNKIPVICNQENFLLRNNYYKIRQCLPNFHIISKPAIKVNLSHGRPVNGMFIAIPSILKKKIVDVFPDNNRIQAFLLKMNNQVFLIINTYFPTDTRNNNAAENEVENKLEAIDSVLKNNNFHKVFFTGDINCEFNRNSVHVNFVREF